MILILKISLKSHKQNNYVESNAFMDAYIASKLYEKSQTALSNAIKRMMHLFLSWNCAKMLQFNNRIKNAYIKQTQTNNI